MSIEYKVSYWGVQGRAEKIRLVLAAGGFNWSNDVVEKDLAPLRATGKLLFDQVPLVTEINHFLHSERHFVQSNAVVRYLAKKAGLAGKDEDEIFAADSIAEGFVDLTSAFIDAAFKSANKEEAIAKLFETTVPKTLSILEGIVSRNPSGFYVGDSLTYVDLLSFGMLDRLESQKPDSTKDYPFLRANHEKVAHNERIREYLASPKRF